MLAIVLILEAVHHAQLHPLPLCLDSACNDLTHGSGFFSEYRCTNNHPADATERDNAQVSKDSRMADWKDLH